MYKVFSLTCNFCDGVKIWRAFQNKLAKLLDFSLGEKTNSHFFVQKKNTTYLWQMGLFFLVCNFCDGENLANFSKKKKTSKTSGILVLEKRIPIFCSKKERTPLIYGK
jgi:hypothetical protein